VTESPTKTIARGAKRYRLLPPFVMPDEPPIQRPLNPVGRGPSVVGGNKRTVRCVQRVEGDGRETLYSAVRTQRQAVNKVEGPVDHLVRGS
jgi:hypothetical protein